MWDTTQEREWSGVVRSAPYPALVDDEGEPWLIVEMGKFGAHERVEPFDGAVCKVRGFALTRGGRRMIELLPGEDAFARVGAAAPAPALMRPGGEMAVVGEIVDGKCYLGAMKPGDGKAHKACAVLCIRGGLPALVSGDISGAAGELLPILTIGGRAELPEAVLEFVGEPVRIEGTLSWWGGLPVLDAEPAGVQRIGGG